ncbi:GTPase HflX [Neobittarella massiliensis]|uniref:GTPase HflX n=1 Tax=Neobittarella massiliensis (ex Bilen et al. 2018) TaxID=2041842 RepID=UPI000CF60591|nr:GTPase HflX [Neobittarella massiliensis]
MYETQQKRPRALAVALDSGEYDVENSLCELSDLADTAGIDMVLKVVQRKEGADNATFVGKGKLEEIRQLIENEQIDILLFDDELSPVQIRNIEELTGLAPVDRTMLIMDIFAMRAKTREGEVQVELAQHRYRLPRLMGAGKAMSRLGGGIGTRGPGESKLESDRRHIQRRIQFLQSDLKKIENHRELTRKNRLKTGIPTVAIVGYTNVGKSTLLNRLTGAQVLVENKLFATLDPTARKLALPDGTTILLVDTVGFVSRLPHHLVKAFQSTLRESAYADLILQVCDVQSDQLLLQMATTKTTLDELDIGDTEILTVFNKCDNTECMQRIPAGVQRDKYVAVSAKTGFGLEQLCARIADILRRNYLPIDVVLPFSQGQLETVLRDHGQITSLDYTADGVHITGRCRQEHAHLFAPYQK